MKTLLVKVISFIRRLQIEVERQFDHSWRYVTGLPTLRHSLITPQLFLGGQYSASGLRRLQQRGITAIVNMRTTSAAVPDLGQIHYLHLPTPDNHAPNLAALQKGISFITQEINNQGKVYIHCAHGEGRGPSMAIAYLMSTGLTLADALSQVQKVRSFARPTHVQMERLKELERLLLPLPPASS